MTVVHYTADNAQHVHIELNQLLRLELVHNKVEFFILHKETREVTVWFCGPVVPCEPVPLTSHAYIWVQHYGPSVKRSC